MYVHRLKPAWKRKFINAIDSKLNLPVFENVSNRRFATAKAGLRHHLYSHPSGQPACALWAYLAAVLDVFT
jgi:putative transposase